MRNRLPITILALLLGIHLCGAAPYDRAHFETTLRQKLTNQDGPAAYRAAGTVLKSALAHQRSRTQAPFYLSRILSDLRPRLTEASQIPARIYLAKVLVRGYFRGLPADPNDATFIASARTLIFPQMPISQQKTSNFIAIARPFYHFFGRSYAGPDEWIFYSSDFPNL